MLPESQSTNHKSQISAKKYINCFRINYSNFDKEKLYFPLLENNFFPESVILHSEEEENSGSIILPTRIAEMSGLTNLITDKKEISPKSTLYFNNPLKELFTPTEWQNKAIDYIVSKNERNGIVKAPTGSGKTIFAYFLLNRLKVPAIIVVDRDVLVEQWIDRAKEIFEKVNIEKLNSKNIDQLEKNTSDFLVTTVQFLISLIKKDYQKYLNLFDKSIYNAIIYDEAHTTSAAKAFAKSVSLFPNFYYLFGLTATPEINNFPMHKFTVGPVIIDAERFGYRNALKNLLQVKTIKKNYNLKFRTWPGIQQYALVSNYQTVLEKNEDFRRDLISQIKLNLDQNRTILVVVSRIETVNFLSKVFSFAKVLTSKQKSSIDNTTKLIFATYGTVSKGFDYKALDTIISTLFVYGKVSSIQLIGRILRQTSNKKLPMAIFMYDEKIEKMLNINLQKELETKLKK